MKRNKIASIEIYNNIMYLQPVLSFLDGIAANHKNMDMGRYNRMRFVFAEMLKRRIERSYPGNRGSIFIDFYLTDAYFEASIRDKGVPGWKDFSYKKENIANRGEDFDNYIIDTYVDGAGMEKLGPDGQRVYVRQNIINPIEFKKPEPYKQEEVLDENITIKQVLTEEDVIEAIRCIYSEYGYSYSYERLYYVDTFMKMIKDGSIMSFLAVNDHGQTAGHFALAFSDFYKNMPEISTVVIRRDFRRLGLFAKFMEHSEKIAKEKGLRALMGQPVGYHDMSQRAVIRAGYTATALLMAYINSDVESEYNKEKNRLDICACVRLVDKEAYSKIYPPKEITHFVKKIYDRLGFKYDIIEDTNIAETSTVSVEDNRPLKMSKIFVSDAGSDISEILAGSVKDTIKKKNEMIELAILLNSKSCAYAYEQAKKCGFVLSGIIPGSDSGDYLIMQMLTGEDINYDKLIMFGEFIELKNDILNIIGKQES